MQFGKKKKQITKPKTRVDRESTNHPSIKRNERQEPESCDKLYPTVSVSLERSVVDLNISMS